MKLTNFVFTFLLLFLCSAVRIDGRIARLDQITEKKLQYDVALEAAVDDAAAKLVEMDSRRQLILNKDSCIANFFQSLYSGFGVELNEGFKEQLWVYVPIVLITDEEGFYIYYNELLNRDGSTYFNRQWTNRRPYVYQDEAFIYSFTLSEDYTTLYDKQAKERVEGAYEDLKEQFPGRGLFSDFETFDEIRRRTIVNCITSEMSYYINQHNRIGEFYGIRYTFALPVISKEDWYRTINDTGLFVLFQGYPYGAGSSETYNRYAFAGARIKKSNRFYMTEVEGKKLYHVPACSKVTDVWDPYYSKKECALEGAWPCVDCNP